MYTCRLCPNAPTFETVEDLLEHFRPHFNEESMRRTQAMLQEVLSGLNLNKSEQMATLFFQTIVSSGKTYEELREIYRQVLKRVLEDKMGM